MTKKQKIGFIGTGVMGRSMASHILQQGYDVLIYTRTKSKADELITNGAIWKNTVAEVAKASDVIITMIGTPKDVEEVYFADNGILANANTGTTFIDMTTSKPSLAVEIATKAQEKGMYALDAPVSGGDVGAKNAALTIMVGGEASIFQAMLPLLEVMGNNIVHQGKGGAGQHTKMVNQISIAPAMIGLCEALIYTEKAGLDGTTVLQSIATGAAGSWSLDNYAPRMLEEDFAPGFAIKHFIKDMKIALESAEEMNMDTPGLSLALEMYEKVASMGEEEQGIHGLLKYYD